MSIEITPALLSDLRQKAGAATPGEWLIGYGGMDGDYAVIISRFCGNEICVESYAEFIAAANPAVVLALVAEVERLRSFQAVAVEVIDKLNVYHECSDDQCRSCEEINVGIELISKAKREASNAD
jgi:hypothetical protein